MPHNYPALATLDLKVGTDSDSPTYAVRYLEYNVASQLPLVVFFTGFGEQSQRALSAAAEPFALAGFPVTAVAIPFNAMRLSDAQAFIDGGIPALVKRLNPENRPFVLAGMSRGAAVAAAASYGLINCQALVMVSPLGIGEVTPLSYLGRIGANFIRNRAFLDRGSWATGNAVAGEIVQHIRSPEGLPAALRFAMGQAALVSRGLRYSRANGTILQVFVGRNDLLFPPAGCERVLQDLFKTNDATPWLTVVNGGHETVVSRSGQRQLTTAAAWLATAIRYTEKT